MAVLAKMIFKSKLLALSIEMGTDQKQAKAVKTLRHPPTSTIQPATCI